MSSYETPLYSAIASIVDAYHRSVETKNTEWIDRHKDTVCELVKNEMPSGSGFDSGTTLDLDRSTGERLVFATSFHHMDEHGGYDGWTDHEVIVTASLLHAAVRLRITGRNRNDIKEYIHQVFADALQTPLCGYCRGNLRYKDPHKATCRRHDRQAQPAEASEV